MPSSKKRWSKKAKKKKQQEENEENPICYHGSTQKDVEDEKYYRRWEEFLEMWDNGMFELHDEERKYHFIAFGEHWGSKRSKLLLRFFRFCESFVSFLK